MSTCPTGAHAPDSYDGAGNNPERVTAEHTQPRTPTPRIRAILLVASVGALLVLAWSPPVHRAVLDVFEAAKGLIAEHPFLGAVLFVVLSALAAMLAFF